MTALVLTVPTFQDINGASSRYLLKSILSIAFLKLSRNVILTGCFSQFIVQYNHTPITKEFLPTFQSRMIKIQYH